MASVRIAPPFSATESGIPTLDQALICEKAGSAIFIRKIRPYHIIEQVVLDGSYYRGQGTDRFRPTSRLQDRRIDREARDVVQMGMRNENTADNFSKDMGCVGFCCLVRQLQALEWAFCQHALIILRAWNIPTQLPDDPGKHCARINGDY